MGRKLLRDVYEFLYESFGAVRILSNVGLWILGKVSPAVRKKINERIEIEIDLPLQFHESGSIPYGEIILNVHNGNHSTLKVDAFQINLSLSHYPAIFHTFSWDRESISTPPDNYQLSNISGKDSGVLRFSAMLPYFLYFPERDMTIFVEGTIKFNTAAGQIEHEFEARTRLLREPLWNMSTVQEDLLRNFSPSELAIEKEREKERKEE